MALSSSRASVRSSAARSAPSSVQAWAQSQALASASVKSRSASRRQRITRKNLVKQLYSISIDDSIAKQIVNIAQQKYAVRSESPSAILPCGKMLMLYSQATGHKTPPPR